MTTNASGCRHIVKKDLSRCYKVSTNGETKAWRLVNQNGIPWVREQPANSCLAASALQGCVSYQCNTVNNHLLSNASHCVESALLSAHQTLSWEMQVHQSNPLLELASELAMRTGTRQASNHSVITQGHSTVSFIEIFRELWSVRIFLNITITKIILNKQQRKPANNIVESGLKIPTSEC